MSSSVEPTLHLPVYFIGHAGVGLLFDDRPVLESARANLREVGEEFISLAPRPKAIVAFSGHFEAGEIHGPGVFSKHDFVNDFHDSRPLVYEYEWPHRDAPDLATQLWQHLRQAGIRAKRVERGVDHGIWVPFKVMFPEDRPLDIPLIQISTFHGYHLESQIRLGEALHSLRHEGFLILGSGMAVHSFASIQEIADARGGEEKKTVRALVLSETRSFDAQLRAAVAKKDGRERKKALLKLEALYEFRRSHPTVEHFTPLPVAAGAAGDAEVVSVGVDLVEPGMSYLNLRFS
ncbi:Extradiol ring-cleavage dioxygenase, class III enzyme, subunit B [Aspergillus desertorum]